MKHEYLKVDNNIVHQVCSEDVLICNSYIGLPSVIDKKIFNSLLAKKLNDKEREAFHFLYNDNIPARYGNEKISQNNYILKSIFTEIPKSKISNSRGDINDILIKNYFECTDSYILNNEILDENSEKRILKALGRNDLIIDECERAKLTNFFENNSEVLSAKILYTTMFNDTKHPHYYKKEHEHVPGMMVIESVRQALYAYTYTFKKCNRGDVSISITKLNSNFYKYAQSNYPLKIMVEDNLMPGDNFGRDLKLKAKLFQRNSLVAEIFYEGSIMKLNAFKRMRLMGKDEEEYTFYPIKDNYDSVILITENTSCVYSAKLKEISMRGMRLLISTKENFEIDKKFKMILGIKKNNKVVASCQLESISNCNNGVDSYFKFINLEKNTVMDISDYIKNYTYINDKGLII